MNSGVIRGMSVESAPPPRQEAPEVREPPPIAPTARAPSAPSYVPSPKAKESRSRRSWIRFGLFALLPLALIVGCYWYVTGGRIMSTDNAYVNAETVGISNDIAGIVLEVDVAENQHVAAGQILYRLKPLAFQIALDGAKANLAQTALTVESMKEDYKRMLSDAAAMQAQAELDQINYDRAEMLLHSATVPQSNYDQAKATLDVDKSKLESLRQQAAVQLAKLGGSPDIPLTQQPQYSQARAEVDEAQRQFDHTVVKAPFDGIVTNVPSIAPGKYLAASTTAFFLVDADHVWVDATPKETELTYVRPGQPVTVTVDAYPSLEWRGTVESISPAAAQQFALLPAQNTSGNWVKVVQRIPMRVRVDTSNQDQPRLRAGMSAEVDVDTGHARGFPHLFDW
jgi:membrane fusion protein, multidrug efflux system